MVNKPFRSCYACRPIFDTEASVLWLATCGAIVLALSLLAYRGWRLEMNEARLTPEPEARPIKTSPALPKRQIGFSGTLGTLSAGKRKRAG